MNKSFKLTEGNSILLDLIRGVSAQLVVIGHGISYFGIFMMFHQPNFPWIQNIAVLIFFILSGFLISYSTFRKMKYKKIYSFKQYFIDRFSRIYSAFIPSLIVVFFIDTINIKTSVNYKFFNAFDIKTFFANVFMLQDYPLFKYIHVRNITSFGSARPFWTLAVEWWIYIFVGYFILVFIKNEINFKKIIILGFISFVPIFNFFNGRGNGLFAFWLFGALIYLVLKNQLLSKISKHVKILMIIVLTLMAIQRVRVTMKEYEAVFAFIISFIILLLVDLFKNYNFSKLSSKLIRAQADYSYTLYLLHYSVLDIIYNNFEKEYNPYFLFVLGVILSNIISFLVGYLSENKLNRFIKNKLYAKYIQK